VPEVIEIAVPVEEIAARRERLAAVRRFEAPDRVPCIPAVAHRYVIPRLGVSFQDYYADAEVMLRTQILGQKWLFENVRTDAAEFTGPWICAWPDFQNTYESGSLGCEVVFPADDIPWVGPGWVHADADLRRLETIDIVDTGVNRKQISYRRRMLEVAEDYPVRFRGGEVFHPGREASLTDTSHGPFGVAGDLMGVEALFLAVVERPDFVRELLRIVTGKIIDWIEFCRTETNGPHPGLGWTDDLAVSLSAEQYRELVLPFEKELRLHFGGRAAFHMCGRSDHLLDMFVDELEIDEFTGFGYQVDLDRVAERMGGRVVLMGNVNPMLIHSGTPERVREAARRVIEKLAPHRGFILQDGSNIPPGSPLENINAMMEAAERWGTA
jgi:uroporphyrinogen decarboxylase